MAAAHKVCVVGARGRMGEAVRAALANEPSLQLAAALEAPGHPEAGSMLPEGVALQGDAEAALAGCQVAIDFTVPAATLATLRAAADAGVAYVTGTTGLSEPERVELAGLASRIPVIHAPNFSLAVNVLAWLAREAARRLGSGFDAEIVELHHSAKRDAPSGTALRLGRAIAEGRGEKLEERLVLERAGEIGARPEGAIGIQTLRGGDNPGEHSIYFVGRGERLELAHRSFTRDHFARGAVRAAAWLAGRPPALYPLEQILGLE
ncbi:MAG: 4-hydroxy-tetrahydrodipicolinate reductase [Deltaproteobacteria bacterium]|nr:4-hydroxy-tetrahydrodipicolinate reductase [Deltaproteobacteria bacterium]